MTLVFFLAFLSFLWLLGLPLYWLFFWSSAERKGVYEKWEWYRTQPFWPRGILKVIFAAANAWIIFPLRGALVSASLIALFWLLQR